MRVLAPLLASLAAACGWHAGLVVPEGRTVGVEVFETRRGLLERGLEPELSDALTRAVSDFVGAPMAAPAQADLVVRGQVLEYERRSGVRSTGNELTETGLLVAVAAELVDRAGNVLASRTRHVWSGYALEGDVLAQEAVARRRALRHVAETLVLDLFAPDASAPEAAPNLATGGDGPH